LTFWRHDIQSPDLVGIIAGTNPDVIFHLAAQTSMRDPFFDARSNVLGTVNLCEASRRAGGGRIVYPSSLDAHSFTRIWSSADEPNRPIGLSPCAAAKLAGELYLAAYATSYPITPICLALADVYGPRQHASGPAGVITRLATAMLAGERPTTTGPDVATFDFVHVDDVVDAFLRAAVTPAGTTGTYPIGSGRLLTEAAVRDAIGSVLDGHPSSDQTIPEMEAHTGQLGWRPRVSFTQGLRQTIEWLSSTHQPRSRVLVGA
jgi:UDP-glucose 4-epimerase